MKKLKFTLFLFLFAAAAVFGQPEQSYNKGAIFDEEAYNQLPRKAALATRSYEGLPKSFSLKQYAPLPGDQTDYGTCVAWASAYAARTISESVALDRKNQTETTGNVFSPVYVYRNIRPDDPECQRGAQIYSALNLMRDSGAVKMLDIERSIAFPRVDLSNYYESKKYPIAGYVTLFSREDKQKPAFITRMVKKSLAEGKPVVIGMNTPDSFLEARNVWEPSEDPGNFYGGHAMCVVGYDDNRGAFELINSWGRKWGNGGFIWVPYTVFVDFVIESYELIENLAIYSDTIKYEGFARIEIFGRDGLKPAEVVFSPNGYYKTSGAFTEGTQFRFVVGAGESAYVYSFAVSQPARDGNFYAPVLMFPQPGISPILNYRDNAVILPGEDKALALDSEAGTEYLVTLYAKQPLDIQTIMRRFVSASVTGNQGSLRGRLDAAVGGNLLWAVSHNEKEAVFTAVPDNPQTVVALVLAIDHR
jgi:C1A family cysteine protease